MHHYARALKTCLNPPRGIGEKRIGTLASEDEGEMLKGMLRHGQISTNHNIAMLFHT